MHRKSRPLARRCSQDSSRIGASPDHAGKPRRLPGGITLLAALFLLLAFAPSASAADFPYVALGDSVAGYYVGSVFSDYQSSLGVNQLLSEAEGGATSTSLITGGQLSRGLADINAATDTRAVTIEIGGNDALGGGCPGHWDEPDVCPFRGNFAYALGELEAALAADPGTERFTAMAYYNPASGAGDATEASFDTTLLGDNLSVGCSDTGPDVGLNDVIYQEAVKLQIPVANPYPAFKQHGQAYMSDSVHPNSAGGAAIAQAFGSAGVQCRTPINIDSGPSGLTNDASPSFAFFSEPGTSFECRLDSSQEADFQSCTSPKSYGSLADGSHSFEVRAGTTDPSPASRSFTVDTTPPETTIDSGPSASTNDPTPTFSFSSEPGASFECKLDAGAYAACGSPKTAAYLTDGSHTFYVRATDPVGNTDPSPATRTFTVRTAAIGVSGKTLVVTAAPGVKDNLAITRKSPSSRLRVTTGSFIHTGAKCTRSGDKAANCNAAGITRIKVLAGNQADRVTNETAIASTLNGGPGNDVLIGGSAKDTLTGAAGADVLKGRNGNDLLKAHDLASDRTINCGVGADKADLDKLPKDPNSRVKGCERRTRH
jgi:lysophospholipase L1-like esterase